MSDWQGAMAAWEHAHGEPAVWADLKVEASDFFVKEIASFEPSGAGEHIWLYIQKERLNTEQVAKKIARLANVAYRDVGYSGLKDFMAITQQWFSVGLAGKAEPDWQQLENEQLSVLVVSRHVKKLKRGTHRGNEFQIQMRRASGGLAEFSARANGLIEKGVPNYFGEQRFGRQGSNVERAIAFFAGQKIKDRSVRSLVISSARSWLFNQCLSERVRRDTWLSLHLGEPAILAGTGSYFTAEQTPREEERLLNADIHPSSPLWGAHTQRDIEYFQALHADETSVCLSTQELMLGLEKLGVRYSRRATRCLPTDFNVETDTDTIQLEFKLEKGQFATSVLRELVKIR